MPKSEARIHVTGIVQGVGFRPFVYRVAKSLNLSGYVLNLGDAGVEIVVQGSKIDIDEFISTITKSPPSISTIESIDIGWVESEEVYSSFEIVKSSETRSQDAVPILPPDIAICDDCVKDMSDSSSRWYQYPFTSCAACGPRFSTITDLPYDRPNTTMVDFPLCDTCNTGYTDPLDRRYHAQTTACEVCGPGYQLLKGSVRVSSDDPVRDASMLLRNGAIVAIQGITGTHICTATSTSAAIQLLRERKKRLQRPFAIMVRDLAAARSFAEIGEIEREILTSWRRPIVLVKRDGSALSVIPDESLDLIAPGLDTIGIMLPYAPAHHLLFKFTQEPALVMTSANPSGLPMYVDRERIVRELGNIVDYSLVHNRVIHQRADDSVVKMVGPESAVFIRRARGHVPEPILFEGASGRIKILGVGPEEKATASILSNSRVYLTQHIGDTDTVESLDFLRSAIDHMLHLLDIRSLDAIACDLHPEFLSTEFAESLAEVHDASLHRVPHHHAHLASVSIDNGLNPDTSIACITADGYGYGTDSSGWGGEILFGNMSQSDRRGGLRAQKYSGGDLSARYAARAAHGILQSEMSNHEILDLLEGYPIAESQSLNRDTVDMMSSSILHDIGMVRSSSAGRFLDAASALLGVCAENSYDAECPMKLEAVARETDQRIEPSFTSSEYGRVLDTTQSLRDLLDLRRGGVAVPDLAYMIQYHLGQSLADIACEVADREGVEIVAFSGGVALNRIITQSIRNRVLDEDYTFMIHRQIPPGDGGVSVGQVATAAAREML